MTKRASRILVMVVSATCCGTLAHAQTAPSTAPADTSPSPTTTSTQELSPEEVARRDLQQLSASLYDGSLAQSSRDEAARRLVARPGAEPRKILTDALEDFSNPGAQLAAVRVLANVPDPDPALIDRFFAAMGSTRQVADAAARALANYKDNAAVLGRMIAIARNDRRSTDAIRNAVIRSLGLIIEKRSAETLVALLQKDDETAAVQAAAADALVQMTGLVEFGQDVAQWSRWWDANKQKSDADFRFDLVNRKAVDGDRLAARYAELTLALRQTLTELYGKTPQSNREELLIAWLRSPEPEIRAIGAGIIVDDFRASRPIPAQARQLLREMIGDSSPFARRAAADALRFLNDAQALDPLLAQIAQESDPSVRAAIASALGVIADARAVPSLLRLLQDPSIATARAGAIALRELGEKIRASNNGLVLQVASALKSTIETRTGTPSTVNLRVACVDALAPLRNGETLRDLAYLIDPRREINIPVRISYLRALTELGDGRMADTIVTALNDKEPSVRLEAVKALERSNPKDHTETLRRRLNPTEEPDASVREQVWRTLEGTFPLLSIDQLSFWADFLKADPNRQVTVLRALAEQLQKAERFDDLATVQQQTGEAYLRTNQFTEAAVFFKAALDYRISKNAPQIAIETLVSSRTIALIRAKQYADAIAFASQVMAQFPELQSTLGAIIRDESDQLLRANDLEGCAALLDGALNMVPPLADRFQADLKRLQSDLRSRMADKERNKGAGSGVGSQNASSSTQPATASGRD